MGVLGVAGAGEGEEELAVEFGFLLAVGLEGGFDVGGADGEEGGLQLCGVGDGVCVGEGVQGVQLGAEGGEGGVDLGAVGGEGVGWGAHGFLDGMTGWLSWRV